MKSKTITIIDSNIHNIFSLVKCCNMLGHKTKIFKKKDKKIHGDVIILPGVGSFVEGMNYLNRYGINEKIQQFLSQENKSLLGICLGMQLLFSKSEEFGETNGLNLIDGKIIKLKYSKDFKIPHIGWSKCKTLKKKYSLLVGEKKYYFVHSFCAHAKKRNDVIAVCKFRNSQFDSVVMKNNVFGTQFHPEKSGEQGVKFLKKVINLV